MQMDIIKDAYDRVCNNAREEKSCYVSLYLRNKYYGGPEEGGWWGEDVTLVASQRCSSEDIAEAMKQEVEKIATQLRKDARIAFGDQCLRELEWCEQRGIDDANSVFGEVDGENDYVVIVESYAGENESFGSRHYE